MSIDGHSLARDTRAFVGDLWRETRWRLVGVLLLTVLAILLEGVTVATAFPVLRELGVSDAGDANTVTDTIDRALDAIGLHPTLTALVVTTVVLSALRWGLLLVLGAVAAETRYRYVRQRRSRLFQRLLGARWSLFWSTRTGNLTNLLVGECERLGGSFTQAHGMATGLVTVAVYAGVAFAATWTVSLLVIASGAVLVLVTRPVERRTYAGATEVTARVGELTSITEEALNGAKYLKASATEDEARRRFEAISVRMSEVQTRNLRLGGWLTASFEVSAAVVLLGVLVIGTRVLDVPPATVLLVSGIFGRLYPRIASVQQARQALATYLPSLRAIEAAEELAAAVAEPVSDDPLPSGIRHPAEVVVEDLTVRYGDTVALDSVSVSIAAGSVTGVVGSSGSGKSTLANALLRLVEPTGGSIGVDGHDVEGLPLTAWRRAVGYVAQETVLFHASVRENVAWGRRETTDDELRRVLRLSGAEAFVDAMPNGVESVVGDRGVLLSGGQRQRLGLARALLGDPVLLVLDEATSSLDAEGEQAVLDAVLDLRGGLTIVMIAHRLATVRAADAIHVIEEGRVVESGTWDDLLRRDNRLAELWRMQSEAR